MALKPVEAADFTTLGLDTWTRTWQILPMEWIKDHPLEFVGAIAAITQITVWLYSGWGFVKTRLGRKMSRGRMSNVLSALRTAHEIGRDGKLVTIFSTRLILRYLSVILIFLVQFSIVVSGLFLAQTDITQSRPPILLAAAFGILILLLALNVILLTSMRRVAGSVMVLNFIDGSSSVEEALTQARATMETMIGSERIIMLTRVDAMEKLWHGDRKSNMVGFPNKN